MFYIIKNILLIFIKNYEIIKTRKYKTFKAYFANKSDTEEAEINEE